MDLDPVAQACDRAAAFLLESCRQSTWSDFLTPVGQSDQWVGAYVANVLSANKRAADVLPVAAAKLLGKQRFNGGWSYNNRAPADSDSTASALIFLGNKKFGIAISAIRRGIRFLLRHRRADGGFATYRGTLKLRLLMKAFGVSFKGWTQSHPCVTAACLNALLCSGVEPSHSVIIRGLDFLRASVNPSTGLWSAYWWQDVYYASTLVIRLFRKLRQPAPYTDSRIMNLLEKQSESGAWRIGTGTSDSAFATALAIDLLKDKSITDVTHNKKRALDWLLAQQESDGSWASVPILRIPHPFEQNPEDIMPWRIDGLGTGVLIRDQNRLFTTATVFRVLTEF